ncbi:MAG: hypothetical protein JHD16_12605 [Solirubrobacteraceae bacterium]|nr:hypothetical protein [Solirubrobacteraceae bacterium]
MRRQTQSSTGWQALWLRQRRVVIALLLVAVIPIGYFVAPGIGGVLLLVVLGLATFTGGGPTENGPQSPPSVPPFGGV